MRPSRARSSGAAASCQMLSSVDCITATFESEFLVHTGGCFNSQETARISTALTPWLFPCRRLLAIGLAAPDPEGNGDHPARDAGAMASRGFPPLLAEFVCREVDRDDPSRVRGPHHRTGRSASAPDAARVRSLLQYGANAPVIGPGCAGFSPGSAVRTYCVACRVWWTASPIRPDLGFRHAQPAAPAAARAPDAKSS